jgi:hypothetical protein
VTRPAGAKRHLHHGNAEPTPQFYPLLLAWLGKLGFACPPLADSSVLSPRKSLASGIGLVGVSSFIGRTLEAHAWDVGLGLGIVVAACRRWAWTRLPPSCSSRASTFGEPLISTSVSGAQHLGAVRHLPWLLVVTDPAERTLPASAVAAMRPNGTVSVRCANQCRSPVGHSGAYSLDIMPGRPAR